MNEQNLKKIPKGSTLNPHGRPKGLRNRATVIKEILTTSISLQNPLSKKNEKLQVMDFLVLAMIAQALKGSVQAFSVLMDGLYGKIPDRVEWESSASDDLTSDLSKEDIRDLLRFLRSEKNGKKPELQMHK